jgi:hypothetical protein
VVVVLVVVAGVVEQSVSDARASPPRHDRMNFFISIIVVWFATLQNKLSGNRQVKVYGV